MKFHHLIAFVFGLGLYVGCAHAPAPIDRGLLQTSGDESAAVDLSWPIASLPVPVLVSPDASPETFAAVDRLTKEINDEIGTVVFDRPISAGEYVQTRIEVAEMDPLVPMVYVYQMQFWNGRGKTADTQTNFNDETGAINSSIIRLPVPPSGHVSDEMITHELGHALGLAHDDQGDSVMSPKVNPGAHGSHFVYDERAFAWRMSYGYANEPQRLTAHDLALLKAKYRLN